MKDILFANISTKVYLLDGSLTINQNKIQTITSKELEEAGIPQETLLSANNILSNLPANLPANLPTNIILVQNNPLNEICNKARQKIKCVFSVTENQFNVGSNSDQGFVSRITPLYLSSTFSLSLNKVVHGYPLENTHIIYSPAVLIFKDINQPKYPMLNTRDVQKISVLTSAPKYRPETNLQKQDKYNFDQRLYLQSTCYKYPEKIIKQLECIFNTALFFGFDTIILDDRGVEDNWSPVHHTAQLLSQVINTFKGRFKEIIVAVPEPHLFAIYKKYI